MKRLKNNLYDKFKNLFVDDINDGASLKNHENLLRPLFWTLVAAAGAILAILMIDLAFGRHKESVLGPFGDFFGGVLNPIFTFLTFFGLIITIVIQRMELRLARLEYSKTATALNTQAIENTFFNVLDLHHEIVGALSFNPNIFPGGELYKTVLPTRGPLNNKDSIFGRPVFNAILDEIKKWSSYPSDTREQYSFMQESHNQVLGHYFRNLYQALKLIDSYAEEILDRSQKDKYASILRAQLSSGELALLYLNCLEGMVDDGQFKNLVVRYRMLEHLPLTKDESFYRLTGNDLLIADSNSISYYLGESCVKAVQVRSRGAYGSNPVELPEDENY